MARWGGLLSVLCIGRTVWYNAWVQPYGSLDTLILRYLVTPVHCLDAPYGTSGTAHWMQYVGLLQHLGCSNVTFDILWDVPILLESDTFYVTHSLTRMALGGPASLLSMRSPIDLGGPASLHYRRRLALVRIQIDSHGVRWPRLLAFRAESDWSWRPRLPVL